jgi:hypothetical protein
MDYQIQREATISKSAIKVLKAQIRLFSRIAALYIIMTFFVFALQDAGFFEPSSLSPLATFFGIPPRTILPMTAYIASPILGMTLLGPMISNDIITDLEALIVLMLGSMLMLPIFALRALLPNYVALFGPKLGLSVVAFSAGLSMIVRLIFLMVFLRLA